MSGEMKREEYIEDTLFTYVKGETKNNSLNHKNLEVFKIRQTVIKIDHFVLR